MKESMSELAKLADDGSARAASELLELLYDELRVLAISMTMKETPGQTIQASDLVHEAYLRLVDDEDREWDGRRHQYIANPGSNDTSDAVTLGIRVQLTF
ncbi:MAG: ECF-type sigma factor [Planctomycetota bacterium]|jgi:DNA-directed RNA polymerase specialized sigma24 family protein